MPSNDSQATTPETDGTRMTKRAILVALKKDYPVLAQCKPLKIDIEMDLLTRCTLSRRKIKQGLRYHLRSKAYLLAVAQGGLRYDLDDKPAGNISPEEQRQARASLQKREAEELARKRVQHRMITRRSAA